MILYHLLLGGCQKQFRKFEVYRNHVYDFHTDCDPVIQSSTFQDQDNPDHWLNCETDSFHDPEMTSSILYSKKRAATTWILKVQEMYKLPQSTMEQILKDVTGFFQNILMELHDELKSILSNSGADHTQLKGFDQLFSANSFYTNPFLELETQHAQLKYYKELLNFVVRSIIISTDFMFLLFSQEPEPVLLDIERQWTGSGKKRRYAEVQEEMMYIPLLKTIQSFSYNTDVVRMVCSKTNVYTF